MFVASTWFVAPYEAIMRKHFLVASVSVFLGICAFTGPVQAQPARVELVLDVSGSMKASMGAQPKIDAAKSALRETISALQEGSTVALRYYGHRVPQEKKEESCKDTELVIPFQPLDKGRMLGALNQAIPRGQTPISYSLEQAASDFGQPSDEERAIILVSDGEETCGGDPLATVRNLAARGIKVKVHTIGFDVDAAARAQLEAISNATGGEYHDARNAAALADSLRQLTQRALLIKRESAYGQEIRGGNTYDDAVAIKADTTYYLDHHQRKDNFDYFAVDAHDGQKIVATVQAHDVGVRIRGEKFEEGKNPPYSGIALHGPNRQAIADKWVASPGQKAGIELPIGAGHGGRFYVLVGNSYEDQHKNSRFAVQLVDISDAKSGRDAGEDDAGAIEIQPGMVSGNLNANDETDYYAFAVAPGVKYTVRVKPTAQEKELVLTIVDRDGVEKKSVTAANGGAAVRIEAIEFPYDGKAFIRVANRKYSHERLESQYSLELTGGSGASTATAASTAGTAAAGKAAGGAGAARPGESGGASNQSGQPPAAGLPIMWIGLGVVAVAVLVGIAYRLGRASGGSRTS
jgi:von Willebrand factor type A domain